MRVVCPTSTPATSVIASSVPVGRTPTFSPKSTVRGRALGLVFCAVAAAVSSNMAMSEGIRLVIVRTRVYLSAIPMTGASLGGHLYYMRIFASLDLPLGRRLDVAAAVKDFHIL